MKIGFPAFAGYGHAHKAVCSAVSIARGIHGGGMAFWENRNLPPGQPFGVVLGRDGTDDVRLDAENSAMLVWGDDYERAKAKNRLHWDSATATAPLRIADALGSLEMSRWEDLTPARSASGMPGGDYLA